MLWIAPTLVALLPAFASAAQLPVMNNNVNSPLGGYHLDVNPSAAKLKHHEGSSTLGALSNSEFTSFSHPAYPAHGMRIRQTSEFCDPTVKSYTGYLDVDYGAKHLFFYFFESRSDPDTDDVLMWINGGPGCSSSLGLFMELGPCSMEDPDVKGGNGTKWNPSSWNTNTNLFFLDQPVGVGFSYADYGETIETTEDAAKNVAAFIAIFFETFSQFKGRAFHMSGESYGGRYLPVFASEIVDQNVLAKAEGRTPINLKSVLIGNGYTDFETMIPSYYDMQCTGASVFPFQDIATCVAMKTALPRCQKWMKEECVDRFDAIGCSAALSFCEGVTSGPFFQTGKNPYDISQDCDGPIQETLCYPLTKRISNYLDRPAVRETLGIDASIGNFSSCSGPVGSAFNARMDIAHPTYFYVAQLLERGIKVLIYVGTYDWICNHVGNYRWVSKLEWSGQDAFAAAELREWTVDGKTAGKTQSAQGLTWATVAEAGHMVPYDKPVESLIMLQRWLAGDDL